MNDTLVGADLAKAVFQLAVSSRAGRFDSHPRLSRDQFLPFFAQFPAAIVIMEGCGTCHFWARKLRELGRAVVLLPPGQVRPFVRRNKTDRSDAKALVEAYRNGEIRPVPVKTPEQQVLTLAAPAARGLDGSAHGAPERPARAAARAGRVQPPQSRPVGEERLTLRA